MADEEIRARKKQTLMQKYDIPIEHLNYDYVEKCNDEKELEKIVKILRSGEEGLFPQLVSAAEARLYKLKPDSRVLCTEEPALRKETTTSEQWCEMSSQMEKWSDEMRAKEKELKTSVSETIIERDLPAVRSRTKISPSPKFGSVSIEPTSTQSVAHPKRSPLPRDYSAWEKYDVDRELTMMEIEEQQQQEERERKKREEQEKLQRAQEGMKRAERASTKPAIPVNLAPTEREVLATREKDKGNELFKVADYENAIKHYSTAIEILPTPVAYNNRAIAWLKLYRYDAALKDCNEVLKAEPDNVKALMRRGIALQNRNSYQKAYDDFSRVVELQPENRLAKSLANQMKTKCLVKRKGVRMKIEEDSSSLQGSTMSKRRATNAAEDELPPLEPAWGPLQEPPEPTPLPDKVFEAPWGGRMNPPLREGYNTSWPNGPPIKGPVTEYGLAKNFCNCSGEPAYVRQSPQVVCLMCHERRVLGLSPLPGRDCNCPKEPPAQPVINGVSDGERSTTVACSSEHRTGQEGSEDRAEEPSEAACDNTENVATEAEEAPPNLDLPPPETADVVEEVREQHVPERPESPEPAFPQVRDLEAIERSIHRHTSRSTVYIPPVRLISPALDTSPDRINVASKYICATTREMKHFTASMLEDNIGETNVAICEGGTFSSRTSMQNGEELQNVEAHQTARITTPYEFTRAWGGTKVDPDLEGYSRILRAVAPEDLRNVVGTKLDGQMLSLMVRTLAKHFITEPEILSQMLHNIALLPRFTIAWAFLDRVDKAAVRKMVNSLEKSPHKLTPIAQKAFQL